MQQLINECEMFATSHEIKFNESKSVLLVYRPVGLKIITDLHVYMNSKQLKVGVQCRYLGHMLCNDMTDNKDIKHDGC